MTRMLGILEWRDPEKLLKHPRNIPIYGDAMTPEFLESTKDGIETAIILGYPDGVETILSGHRRTQAARIHNHKQVPVEPRRWLTDPEECRELLVRCNSQREKTKLQISREINELVSIESEKAAKRKLAALKQGDSVPPCVLQQGHTGGRAAAIVAKNEGISRKEVQSTVFAVRKADEVEGEGNEAAATEIRNLILTKGPRAAEKWIREESGLVAKPEKAGLPEDVQRVLDMVPYYTAILNTLVPKAQENARIIKKVFPNFQVLEVDDLCKKLHTIFSMVPVPCTQCKGLKCARCSSKGWTFRR